MYSFHSDDSNYDFFILGTDEDTLIIIYTSPGELDYMRHPKAWQAHSEVHVKGMGKDESTLLLPSLGFEPIAIPGINLNPIISL